MSEIIHKTGLPESWELVPLGEFVMNEKGKKPKQESKEKTPDYTIPYIDIAAFEEGIVKSWTNGEGCKLCYEDDFLMVWDGSRSGLVGKGMSGALGSTLVRINFPGILNDYAFYFLRSKFAEINSRAKGVGIPHVDPNLLWNYGFPIPPTNEQKKIVAKIEELFSELDKGIESLKTARAQLKVYRQAVLKHAFEGKLTADWREKNKVSDTWITVTVDDIGDISTGSTPPTKNPELYGNEYPFFKPTDLEAGFNVIESRDYLSHAGYESARQVPADSVLVTCIGATIGKTGIIRRVGAFNQQINAIVPYPQFLPEFVYFQAIGSEFQEHIKTNYSQTTLPILNKSKFSRLPFVICSKKEQAEIVERLKAQMSVIDKIEEEIETQLQKSETLRQSILKKAFSGQLVTQDPNDEPASVLLERIRAEKMGQSAKKKPKEKRRGV